MSRYELVEYCRSLYIQGGIEALSYASLKKQKPLYPNLYRVGLPQRQLIHELGLENTPGFPLDARQDLPGDLDGQG